MKLNISIKLREIGNITAEFMGSTKDYIFLKNAVINKSSVEIDIMKINKKHIIYLSSETKIDLSIFRKIELKALIKCNGINIDEATAALKKEEEEAKEKEKYKKTIIEDDIKIKSEKKLNNGRKFKKDNKEINQLDDRITIKNDIDITGESKKNKNNVINNLQKDEEHTMTKKISSNDESHSPNKNIKKEQNAEKKNGENNKNEINKKLEDLKINNRKSIIDEELKKEEKRVTSLIENSCDPMNMWSSVSKILVKKNELAGKINGRNDETIKSTDEIKESGDETIKGFNKREKKEGEEKNGKHYVNVNNRARVIKNNNLKEETETNAQNEIGGGYKNNKGYYGNRNTDGINESKSSEKVISTPSLRYEKAADIKQNIVKKFNRFNKNSELLKWSKFAITIEEKIKQIENQSCIFPSKKKIDEIAEFGILLSQQKSNIFKKIDLKNFKKQ